MRRNLERPGLGFQSKTTPEPPPKTTPSIFGLISQINRGLPKAEKNEVENEPVPALATAKAIAEKISVTKDAQKSQLVQEKRSQFLAAKANVERIFLGGKVPQSGGNKSPPQLLTEMPQLSTRSNIFKVPEAKETDKETANPLTSRPGLGFSQKKKYLPKVDVGVGRNVFSEEENSKNSGKFSLVPYDYDENKDDESGSSRSKHSNSSSKGERRFTEERKKTDSKTKEKYSSGKESSTNARKEKVSSGDSQDDYFKYGYGKEQTIPTVQDANYSSNMGRNQTEYTDDFEEYGNDRSYHVGAVRSQTGRIMDVNLRNENDDLRFMNEVQVDSRVPHPGMRGPEFVNQPSSNFGGPQLIPINNVVFGRPEYTAPIHPEFVAFPLPLDPNINPDFREQYHGADQFHDNRDIDGNNLDFGWRSPPRGNFDNFGGPPDDPSWQRNDSEYGYNRQYDDDVYQGRNSRSDSYNRSPVRDEDRIYPFEPPSEMRDNFSFQFQSGFPGRSSRSPSPGRFGPSFGPRSEWDANRGYSRGVGGNRRSSSLERLGRRESAWGNVSPEEQDRLKRMDIAMGYSDRRSRDRDRSRERRRSLDRDRSPRSRSGRRRSLSRERRASHERSGRADSRGSPRSQRSTKRTGDESSETDIQGNNQGN